MTDRLQGSFNAAVKMPMPGYLETRLQALAEDRAATAADLQNLIEEGVNIECTNAKGQTPLLIAASQGNTAMVRSLADAGAKLDVAEASGATALFYLVAHYDEDGVKALLDKGLHPDHARYRGMTALMHAANFNKPDIVEALMLHGADHRLKSDGSGWTAAQYADDNNKKHLAGKIGQWGDERDTREAKKKAEAAAQVIQLAKDAEQAKLDYICRLGIPSEQPIKAMRAFKLKPVIH